MVRRLSKRVPLMPEAPAVRQFMTSPVTSLPSTARLLEAGLLLRAGRIRHIPIIDDGKLVGILSDRDIQRCTPSLLTRVSADEYNAIFEDTPVARVMTRDPKHISPEAPLHAAATMLRAHKLGCLPVIEGGKVIGIITKDDMLAALVRLLGEAPAR
jgi:acetoin utilization protein AcuB